MNDPASRRLLQLSARIETAIEMSIRLKDGYTVNRGPSVDDGRKVPKDKRTIAVIHPEGGSYIYAREPKSAPLEFLRVPPEHRGKGRAKALLDHFTGHLDHRGLASNLTVAPIDREIKPQGLLKLYRSGGWRGAGPGLERAAKSIAR